MREFAQLIFTQVQEKGRIEAKNKSRSLVASTGDLNHNLSHTASAHGPDVALLTQRLLQLAESHTAVLAKIDHRLASLESRQHEDTVCNNQQTRHSAASK
jgi:hypothetical protein